MYVCNDITLPDGDKSDPLPLLTALIVVLVMMKDDVIVVAILE